ncbi:hypothetical protein ACQCVP_20185 [Rossellomorea vietnamensis]|uniref:hypothetical protein n=1 Tax=Rossellomorea vietnamensis TaxID=218284 RepID=UPI003CED8A40
MDSRREQKIKILIQEIREFELNFNSYLVDSGYIELVDSILEGKVRALKYYLHYLNMDTLLKEFDNIKFESGQAVINLEILRNFILSEVELELEYYKH